MGIRNWLSPDWENWDEIPKNVIAIAMDKSGQVNGFTTPPRYVTAPAIWAATKNGRKITLSFLSLMGDDATNQSRAGRSCSYRPGCDPGKNRPRALSVNRPDFTGSTAGQQIEPGKRPEPIVVGMAPGNNLPVARAESQSFDTTDDLAFSGRVNRAPLVALGVTTPDVVAAPAPKVTLTAAPGLVVRANPSTLEVQVGQLTTQLADAVAAIAALTAHVTKPARKSAKQPAKKPAKSKTRRK